ncbi:MAG: SirB2 family protein [Wenzhouxiangellaceae bacterium]|nr:SirB2 family protein [Wenzhouxiangellaceae bacterium]
MATYELLKSLHVALALVSGLGFALRGFIRLVLRRELAHPLVRFGPHVIDTLLLASGASLWVLMQYSPLAHGWFGAKLVLIVVYILLGIGAFRARRPERGVLLYLAALATFGAIAWLALFKTF